MVARFFIGDALGIVTLAPTLLLLNSPWRTYFRHRRLGAFVAGLLAAGLILYLEVAELLLGRDQGRLSYFVMLPVVWNAVAFGVLGAALSTLLANVSITLATFLDPNEQVLAGAPYFMLSIGYLSLIIAGAVKDRDKLGPHRNVQPLSLSKFNGVAHICASAKLLKPDYPEYLGPTC